MQSFALATVSVTVSLGAKPAQAEAECLVARRLDTVALLHTCFLCLQTCLTHVTILPTHSRWLKVCQKTELHLTVTEWITDPHVAACWRQITCLSRWQQQLGCCGFVLLHVTAVIVKCLFPRNTLTTANYHQSRYCHSDITTTPLFLLFFFAPPDPPSFALLSSLPSCLL